MNKPLVRIVPAKGGFMVQTFSENNEMLSSTEIIKKKQDAYKNLQAQQKALDSTGAIIILDESTGKKYNFYASGFKILI